MTPKPHKGVLFLAVPESLRGQVAGMAPDGADNFSIDPAIPIPVEIPENRETINLEELSWEMIVSGMLRVIAAGEESEEWIGYYRHFVLTVRPTIMQEFTEAAILQARGGDFDRALEILDTLRGMFPASPVVALNRALVMEERAAAAERRDGAETQAAFQAAQAAYTDALAMQPPFPDTQFNAGFFYLGRKEFSRARECFSRYIEIAADRVKIDRSESIIREIDRSGLEDERLSEAFRLIQQGNEEKGMLFIRDFIEAYPSVWNGWFVLGWALRRQRRWEDAAAAFGKAIEQGGSGGDIRNELAICLMELHDLKGARRELEAALRDDPENTKIISNLGVVALKNGNPDEAAAFFRTVLAFDPQDPIARELLAQEP